MERLALALAAVTLVSCNAVGRDGVAATVNGAPVTYVELEKYYQTQTQDQEAPADPDQERMLRLNLLRELIDREILLQRAEGLGLMAVDTEVDARLEEYRAPFPDQLDFERSLAERQMNLQELREEIRRSLTIEKLFNKEISSRVKVTEVELKEYYEQNKAQFTLAEQHLHMAQILVTPTPETPAPNLLNDDADDEESAQAKIRMIEDRLANGEDFAALAQNYSEDTVSTANGGDMGFIPQSSLEKADITLRRAVAALSVGDTSPVLESGGQYRLIQLISKEPAGERAISDPRVQQVMRETLTNRKDQLAKAAYLEVARNDADVVNYYAKGVVGSFGLPD